MGGTIIITAARTSWGEWNVIWNLSLYSSGIFLSLKKKDHYLVILKLLSLVSVTAGLLILVIRTR
jgi:hypothetical protein